MSRLSLRVNLLRTAAGLLGLAGVYHVLAMGLRALDPGSSPLRHVVFALIDGALACALWWRPRGLFWVFVALGMQQLHSHGRALVQVWQAQHRIDWASVLVLLGLPLVCALLYERPVPSHAKP